MKDTNELFSPINGSPLVPVAETGLLYCKADGLYYTTGKNGIEALKSPINGSPLVPDSETGLLYSEADGSYYTTGANGIEVLQGDKLDEYLANKESNFSSRL